MEKARRVLVKPRETLVECIVSLVDNYRDMVNRRERLVTVLASPVVEQRIMVIIVSNLVEG